ncbi:glycosyltransferase family 39 protein [Patescibacteria group bacterium]
MKKLVNKIIKIFTNEYFLFGIILVGAFLVRLYKIDNPIADWHSWRQADTSSVTRVYLNEGVNLLIPKYHDLSGIQSGWHNTRGYRFVEFPFFNVAHLYLYKIYPTLSLEVWGRLTAVFFTLISTVFVFLLGNKFIGKWGGVLSAFFFAFLPFNIYFTRIILPEPLAVMLALMGLWLYVKFIDSQKSVFLFTSAIVFTLSLLVKPYTIFYLVPAIYLTVNKFGMDKLLKGEYIKKFILFVAFLFLPFLAWRIWMNDYAAGIPFYEWTFNGGEYGVIRFHPAFWRWIFAERLGKMILGIWGVGIFIAGVVVKPKRGYFIHTFLLGMFLYVSVVAAANIRHDYYQILTIPAIVLALGLGSNFLLKSKSVSTWLSKLIWLFLVGLMFMVGVYQIKDMYNINHPEIIEAGNAVDRLTPKDAKVIASYNADTAFLYQTGRKGWPIIDDSLDNIIRRGASFYVTLTFDDKDTRYIVENYEVIEKTDKYLIADLTRPKEK